MIASNRLCRTVLLAALLASPGLHAAEVAGVQIPDSVRLGNNELLLNGAGLRSKFFFKVYVGALYVRQKASTPAAVYDGAPPRRMALRMLREVDAQSLQEALEDGLKNNLSEGELAEMKQQAEQLSGIMRSIGKAKEGDTVTIDFLADGVAVSVNGEAKGKVAGGGAFGRALLRVWLGDKPADAALKKALLGG